MKYLQAIPVDLIQRDERPLKYLAGHDTTSSGFNTDDDLPLQHLVLPNDFGSEAGRPQKYLLLSSTPKLNTVTKKQQGKGQKTDRPAARSKVAKRILPRKVQETSANSSCGHDEIEDSYISDDSDIDIHSTPSPSEDEETSQEGNSQEEDSQEGIHWEKKTTPLKPHPFTGPTPGSLVSLPASARPLDYFLQFLPGDIWSTMETSTNNYAPVYEAKRRKQPGTATDWTYKEYKHISADDLTIQPHILVDKLMLSDMHASTVLWILSYLTNRPQYVKLSGTIRSDVIFTSTGAPQGTVLSPFLFSVYTADCRSSHTNCIMDKYADDTVLTGLITDDDDLHYRWEIDSFVQWCERNYLELHVGKTKEMVVDFRRNQGQSAPVVIKGNAIERVKTFKYLGVLFDDRLSWKQNTNVVLTKANTRLFCLRKLKSFNVRQELLQMFYSSVVSSVLTFGLLSWGGNICRRDRETLDKVIRKASGVVGRVQDNLDILHDRRMTQKLNDILDDATHPLRLEFDDRLIQRSGRMRVPKARTSRYSNSFVPRAIISFNRGDRGGR